MTSENFRTAALALAGTIESAHMQHPDFRVHGHIFATLTADGWTGMVKLPADEQQRLINAWPEAFMPAAGEWGRQGSTLVRLAKARRDVVEHALELAWSIAKAAAPVPVPVVKKAKPRPSSAAKPTSARPATARAKTTRAKPARTKSRTAAAKPGKAAKQVKKAR